MLSWLVSNLPNYEFVFSRCFRTMKSCQVGRALAPLRSMPQDHCGISAAQGAYSNFRIKVEICWGHVECSSLAVASLPIPLPSPNTSRGSLWALPLGIYSGFAVGCKMLRAVLFLANHRKSVQATRVTVVFTCFHGFARRTSHACRWTEQLKQLCCKAHPAQRFSSLFPYLEPQCLIIYVRFPQCTCNCILHGPQIGSFREFESLRVCGFSCGSSILLMLVCLMDLRPESRCRFILLMDLHCIPSESLEINS